MATDIRTSYQRATSGLLITATDITGAYNATTNAGGYGGPNISVGDFTSFNINCYLPDSVTLIPQSTPVVIPAYSTFPSAANATFDLTSLLLLGDATTKFIDGWYQFIVTADYDTGATQGVITSSPVNLLMYETVQCCMDNLLVKSLGCGCSGSSKKISNIVLAQTNLLTMIERTVLGEVIESMVDECDQYNNAVAALLLLQRICDSSNCKGCGGC